SSSSPLYFGATSRSAVSAPTTNVVPGNKRDFSTKVGALVSSTGDFQANCASRRLTVAPASGGLSTLVTEISNAKGCRLNSSATRASNTCPSCNGLKEPGNSTKGQGA